jgi:hypothetical protein
MERVMGIEYIAREPLPVSNHGVASADGRCVRFMCEEQPHTSQRQPTPAILGSFHPGLPLTGLPSRSTVA